MCFIMLIVRWSQYLLSVTWLLKQRHKYGSIKLFRYIPVYFILFYFCNSINEDIISALERLCHNPIGLVRTKLNFFTELICFYAGY